MNFTMPEARRERMEQLLEYLGDRADDFKKCFDIESEWCWKYAAIVIDGLKIRKCYLESHHIIPVAYYKPMVKISHRFSASYTVGNLTALTCAEHIMAHYCMFMCARNVGIHAYAFMILYNVFKNGCRKRENAAAALFTDEEVLGIMNSCPRVANVTDAGRTHYYQDPKKAHAEWRLANIERIHEYDRYRNKFSRGDYMKKYLARYWRDNKKRLQEYKKNWAEENAEHLKIYNADYYQVNYEKIRQQQKSGYDAKVAAGYRYRKDPVTGKHKWVFVGLPEQEVAA